MLGIGMEAVIFLYAVLSGIVIFSGYHILYMFRRLISHSVFLVGIEDLLYWISVSVYLFRQMYHTTFGSIRWYFVLGVIFGNIAAYAAGRVLKRLWRSLRNCLKNEKEKDRMK